MKTKEKIKKIFSIALLSIMLLNMSCINAVEFNPDGTGKDDETHKEYTATLVDLQINSVMALNLDELNDTNSDALSLVGSVKINKKIDEDNIEYLNEMPQISLVDENNNTISIAEVIPQSEYSMTQSDLYYINLYDLDVQEGQTYRLVAKITDNDNNVITKDITYSDSLIFSQGTSYNMSYESVNNILNISFSKVNSSTDEETHNIIINGIDITQKQQYINQCFNEFIDSYNASYNQMDFDIVHKEVESLWKTHMDDYLNSIGENINNYIYSININSIHDITINVSYIIGDSEENSLLGSKEIKISYLNDNFQKSSKIQDQINEALSNITTIFQVELELDNNYNKNVSSYDYIKNILKITDNNIVVKELKEVATGTNINQINVKYLVLGTSTDVYDDSSMIMIAFKPVISIPSSYDTNEERFKYAKDVINKYINDNPLENATIESVELSSDDENIIEIKVKYENGFMTITTTDEIRLQTIDYLKGDLDKNGAVNANDAAVALDLYKYGNVTEKDIEIGDMNDDGVINANDAALILDVYKYGG